MLEALEPLEDLSPADSADRELAALLVRLDRNDLEALAGIWRCCADDLYGLALWRSGVRCDAEDAVQEVFVSLARCAGRLGRVRRPRAYLLKMARNAAVAIGRRKRAAEPVDGAELVGVDGGLAAVEESATVAALLSRLPAAQREVVYLKHLDELTFREIGAITGTPTFTAASRYRLAMRRLRRLAGGTR
jgi:RNA polymerase sigma factor (sigma-70 family)